jgi:hypothetical protein
LRFLTETLHMVFWRRTSRSSCKRLSVVTSQRAGSPRRDILASSLLNCIHHSTKRQAKELVFGFMVYMFSAQSFVTLTMASYTPRHAFLDSRGRTIIRFPICFIIVYNVHPAHIRKVFMPPLKHLTGRLRPVLHPPIQPRLCCSRLRGNLDYSQQRTTNLPIGFKIQPV